MQPDYLFATRAEIFKHELYRNPNTPVGAIDLSEPKPPSQGDSSLLEFGRALFFVGTHLKSVISLALRSRKEIL